MRLTKSCKISLHKKVNISIASARSAGQEETSWWEQHGSGRWADQRGVAKEIDDNDQDDDDGDGDDGYGDDDDGDGDNQVNELVAGATVKVEADGGDGHQQMVGDTTFILYPFFSAHCAGPKGPCACYWQTDPHSEGGWDLLARTFPSEVGIGQNRQNFGRSTSLDLHQKKATCIFFRFFLG